MMTITRTGKKAVSSVSRTLPCNPEPWENPIYVPQQAASLGYLELL